MSGAKRPTSQYLFMYQNFRIVNRQIERERRPLPRLAGYRDFSLVVTDDFPANGESEAHPEARFSPLSLPRLGREEGLKRLLDRLLRHPPARVRDVHPDMLRVVERHPNARRDLLDFLPRGQAHRDGELPPAAHGV